jgi:hypothetical protein
VRFDSIHLTYDVHAKVTNALVCELRYAHDHVETEYFEGMLNACCLHWAHPLLVPAILLDMLMSRLEDEIVANVNSIQDLERKVTELPSLDVDSGPLAERENLTSLLTNLHDTLKGAVKLLDAARWMRKASELLHKTGEELDELIERVSAPTQLREDWAELRQFLEDLIHLTAHLEPEPVMSQQRCQSQIDIVSTISISLSRARLSSLVLALQQNRTRR